MNSHLDLVADSNEEETTFGAVNSDLSDELVEALGEKLLSDGADASLPGLS